MNHYLPSFWICVRPLIKNYEVVENRYFAIKYTIKIAKESDIIVIAGKGNEKDTGCGRQDVPLR